MKRVIYVKPPANTLLKQKPNQSLLLLTKNIVRENAEFRYGVSFGLKDD